MKITERELWVCPKCGAPFVNKNSYHACGVYDLDSHFAKSEPHVRLVYDAFLAEVEKEGPVRVIPQKTRIVFMDRVRFSGAIVQKTCIKTTFIFHELWESPRFEKVEFLPPNYYLHVLKIRTIEEIDDEVRAWIKETWKYGRQDRLK